MQERNETDEGALRWTEREEVIGDSDVKEKHTRLTASAAGTNGRHSSNTLGRYFLEARRYPMLTREQERILAEGIKRGHKQAQRELVEANLLSVPQIAREYIGYGMPFKDLLSEGNVGLVEAARRFDATRGAKFITYAHWWVRKQILMALDRENGPVRIPTHKREWIKDASEAYEALRRKLRRKPSCEEASEWLKKHGKKSRWGRDTRRRLDDTLQLLDRTVHLDERVGNDADDRPKSALLANEEALTPEETLLATEWKEAVIRALDDLKTREAIVIRARFGFDGGPPMTLKEISGIIGVSHERVRQIEKDAKELLRKILAHKHFIVPPPRSGNTLRLLK